MLGLSLYCGALAMLNLALNAWRAVGLTAPWLLRLSAVTQASVERSAPSKRMSSSAQVYVLTVWADNRGLSTMLL